MFSKEKTTLYAAFFAAFGSAILVTAWWLYPVAREIKRVDEEQRKNAEAGSVCRIPFCGGTFCVCERMHCYKATATT